MARLYVAPQIDESFTEYSVNDIWSAIVSDLGI